MNWPVIWEKVFKEHEWGKYPDESFIRFVARNFYNKDRKTTKILEVGCGPGANIWYMAREGFDVYGIDGSKTAIERARARLNDEGLKADLAVGDIVQLPYEESYFDAVGDNECLTHNSVKAMDPILAEIKRVLKPGGLFYSRTFCDDVYVGKSRREINPLEYADISDGPFAERGFLRLTTQDSIQEMYGKFFKLVSLDKLEYTYNNGGIKISEWIIICQNEK